MPPKAKAGSAQKKTRAPKAHKLPDPFPKGELLKDYGKKHWRLGEVIGQGGFGLIYLATLVDGTKDETYVVKIEPIANGPLFCELHVYQRVAKPEMGEYGPLFCELHVYQRVAKPEMGEYGPLFCELHVYQRVAKPEMVDEWCKAKKMKYLGVPKYISSGTHTRGKETFRFMVMERFGTDVQKIFEKSGKTFSRHTVCALALRLLDTLEYLHNKGYAHADIKAANLLTGFSHGKEQPNQVYLVDFGLAYKFYCDGVHKEYKEDPKRCHDGTVEFTSTDAHKGVAASRRGDMEILGFCLLQWLCSRLPWENNLENKDYVRDSKIKYMKDIPGLIKTCFPSGSHPDEITKYLTYVSKMKYEDVPDYNKLRSIFRGGISGKDEWKIDLPLSVASSSKKTAQKRKSAGEPFSPVEKKVKSAARVTKKEKESTPKPKADKKTVKNIKSPSASTPRQIKSPVNTPKHITSPRATVSKVATPKIPGKPASRHGTPKLTLAGRKRSRSRSPAPASSNVKKGSPKKSTKRRVKRRKAVQTSDASMQTSPGFSSGSG
ncbi:vaccinia related kinase [Mytilus galloprovincialis]|uniref:non-specific serine/threonine protein kinase n=1 Tax=Mytilus galloprovincialis TaxID=29158 RepID=A0A8B6E3Z5_MYTGA|nr:vaccinia related kinase [Mytilus galloprovincialis]